MTLNHGAVAFRQTKKELQTFEQPIRLNKESRLALTGADQQQLDTLIMKRMFHSFRLKASIGIALCQVGTRLHSAKACDSDTDP